MEYNPFSLNNKTILVTGASSGIGRQTAVTLSKLGAQIILVARDLQRLEETRAAIRGPGEHLIISLDLTEYDLFNEKIEEIKQSVNKIDGIVHCAGISSTFALRSLNAAKLNAHFNINVNAGFMLTRQLLSSKSALVNADASIIFISSVMGVVGEVGKTAYAMTKGAIIAGVKSLSLELAVKKIRVNAISPGVVVTPMSSASFYSHDEHRFNKIKALHPLGLGEPEDVANACAYLLSDASKWVTGSNLIIDGGYTAR